uniref:Uncharacterized protein n=1 Tax=Lotharella vacuolata TaxID=74820 RepID=A0A0H5BHF4_9EUKA|nr:hypothetical protein [Lotharella vacuolata]
MKPYTSSVYIFVTKKLASKLILLKFNFVLYCVVLNNMYKYQFIKKNNLLLKIINILTINKIVYYLEYSKGYMFNLIIHIIIFAVINLIYLKLLYRKKIIFFSNFKTRIIKHHNQKKILELLVFFNVYLLIILHISIKNKIKCY